MKLNALQELLDLEGKPIEGITLRRVATMALMDPQRGDDAIGGDKKAALFALAMKFSNEDAPDLNVDDLKLLRDRVDSGCTPLIVGRVREILDRKDKE